MKISKIIAAGICAAVIAAAPTAYAEADFDAEQAMESVFVLHDDGATGSAFAVGENVIVTNAHVVNALHEFRLLTNGGEEYEPFLIGIDTTMDIAVLGVEDASFRPLPAADHMDMPLGGEVYALGSPQGFYFTVTKGVISSKAQDMGEYDYIQTDAFTYGGSSGGPLMNGGGRVIGVNTQKVASTDGISFSLPIANVTEFINSLGLKTDGNGVVIGRADRSMEIKPELEESSAEESNVEVEIRPAVTAEQMALAAVIAACVAIIADVIVILMLRRTNERLSLLSARQRHNAKNGAEKSEDAGKNDGSDGNGEA